MMASFRYRLGGWLLTVAAWIAAALLILPLIILVSVSLADAGYLQFPPRALSTKWYAAFLSDPDYLNSIMLSMWLAVVSTAIALVLGVLAAVALSRAVFPGSTLLSSLFLSPLVLPAIVLGIAIFQFTSLLGFQRTYAGMVISHVVIILPFIIRSTIVSMSGFNVTLEEAALDLGATRRETFFLVTLPNIKPGLIAGGIFALIISWIDVEVSIFNTVPDNMPIPVRIMNYIQYTVDPLVAAVSGFTVVIAIITVAILDRIVGLDRVATGTSKD